MNTIQRAPTSEARTAPLPRGNWLRRWLFTLGLMSLCFLLGAAVMFFNWPTSDFLSKSFIGARAWFERNRTTPSSDKINATVEDSEDHPDKTFDGFTLHASASLHAWSSRATLIDMRGQPLHHWSVRFSEIWSNPPHIQTRVKDHLVCFFGCHLYPNGDLLAVLHGLEGIAYGYGLVKLDKNSKILWSYAGNIHHDLDVDENGNIYALQHKWVEQMPKGLEHLPAPGLVDSLVVLSPDGKLLKGPLPMLEAIRNSRYGELLVPREAEEPPNLGLNQKTFDKAVEGKDPLHANSVNVLRRNLASKFPRFKPGQVLVCLRNLNAIAVMDVNNGKLVWAARGPWKAQHDAQFLANGRILVFDNRGLGKRSRVLEYDPDTQAFPWSYTEKQDQFYSREQGQCQRLPNGNTLIVLSEMGQMLEVTADKQVVWAAATPRERGFLTTARRYSPQQVQFLKEGTRARP
jgi:Arylsulfotransferase (ASST)